MQEVIDASRQMFADYSALLLLLAGVGLLGRLLRLMRGRGVR